MILDLGLIGFEDCYTIQRELLHKRRLGEIGDSLILAEHKNVFTIGRTGKRENLLASEKDLENLKIPLIATDRGGDITFHGQGQIVLYPIIDLKNRGNDLHKYLRDLETLIINVLRDYGVSSDRCAGRTGVWVGAEKIAFIGVSATDWITYHGASININTDLRYFSMIVPCGLKDIKATSLNALLGKEIDIREAKERISSHFGEVFAQDIVSNSSPALA